MFDVMEIQTPYFLNQEKKNVLLDFLDTMLICKIQSMQ